MSNSRILLQRACRAAFAWGAALSLLLGGVSPAAQKVEIDVMVAFDRAALNSANQSPEEMAQIAVQNLNQVLVRSKLDDQMHFRLVKALRMDNHINSVIQKQLEILKAFAQSQGITLEQLLQNGHLIAQNQDVVQRLAKATIVGYLEDYKKITTGQIPELKQARNTSKADLVLYSVGYLPMALSGMGHGFIMQNEPSSAAGQGASLPPDFLAEEHFMAEFLVACTIQPQSGMDVFSHETMHVLGCGHSDRQKSGAGPFYYADSIGYFTPEAKYSTIMCYNDAEEKQPLPNVPMAPGDSRCINCLSGPYPPRLMGADAGLTDLPGRLGDELHNNRAVALRNAAVVACFRMGGNEKVLNERKEDALSMPPLVNRKTFLMQLLSAGISEEDAAQAMAPTVPGMDKADTYTSTVFGTNAPARRSTGKLDGGTGKVVWYKVEVPENGKCRMGVRPFGTAPGLNPVVAVWNEAGQAMQGKVFTGQAAAAEGYLYAVEMEATKGTRLLIAVDSGNADGGQFSLVSQLKPDPSSATEPQEPQQPQEPEQPPAAEPAEPAGTPNLHPGGYGPVDLMLLIIAFVGGAGLMCLIISGRKAAAATEGVQGFPAGGPAPQPVLQNEDTGWGPVPQQQRRSPRLALACAFPDGTARTYEVSLNDVGRKHNFYIGRKSTADLCIPESSISGCHAVLKIRKLDGRQSSLLVGDAGSTNGTWIDGTRLTGDNCAKVKNGSHLVLGKVRATISILS